MQVKSIIRQVTRKQNDKLNILFGFAHERACANLCNSIDANFYFLQGDGIRGWNERYNPKPTNLYSLPNNQIPSWLTFDCIISGNLFHHAQHIFPLSHSLHLPIIQVHHTMPPSPAWDNNILLKHKQYFDKVAHHVFITDFSKIAWFGREYESKSSVIEHTIDYDLFHPSTKISQHPIVMGVCNDFVNRGREHGFDLWQKITSGLPINLWGDTSGLSQPCTSIEHLSYEYQRSRIFLHTACWSPLSISLLEAAASECAVVTTNVCGVPDFFEHEKNALLFPKNRPDLGRKYVDELLKNKEMAEELGKNARKMVLEKCNKIRYKENWKQVFEKVLNRAYIG